MKDLINTQSIPRDTLEAIWRLVGTDEDLRSAGMVACSFQGSGTRTRTTFFQAFDQLGLKTIELPAFLDTAERASDLAGYLDQFYSLYVIRYRDHEKLEAFAKASKRPVINAMSAREHPCEAIADAHWFHTSVKPLDQSRVLLWGPTTNVLRSWQHIAGTAGAVVSVMSKGAETLPVSVDLVITDGWPSYFADPALSLTQAHLEHMGLPMLLPTPPFTIGQEVAFDPLAYKNFTGYEQKGSLLTVQKAIIQYLINGNKQRD